MSAPTAAWLCVSPGGAKDAAASLEGMLTYEIFGRDCKPLVLRADFDALRAQLEAAEARAEAAEAECARLREALDHVARVALGSRTASKRIVWIVDRCKSALNGDDAWRATSVPKGYHDALERAARTKEQQA